MDKSATKRVSLYNRHGVIYFFLERGVDLMYHRISLLDQHGPRLPVTGLQNGPRYLSVHFFCENSVSADPADEQA